MYRQYAQVYLINQCRLSQEVSCYHEMAICHSINLDTKISLN